MQGTIYLHGKNFGANPPTIFLLGKSTQPREGERGRRSLPEEEAMEEGALPESSRPGVEGGHGTTAGGLGRRRRQGRRVGGEGRWGEMRQFP
jgi:hypothetical protein